jgi:hypothetical protein
VLEGSEKGFEFSQRSAMGGFEGFDGLNAGSEGLLQR